MGRSQNFGDIGAAGRKWVLKKLVYCPSRTMGKSKVVKTHNHKYYPVMHKIPEQLYHGNGYDNTFINIIS